MSNPRSVCLCVFHGRSFERVPHLLYTTSKVSDVYMEPDYMSVDDIKKKVVNLGYSEEMTKEMYFSRPNVPFEDSLVPIQSDKEVRELTKLCLKCDYVLIYVEHNDDEIDKGKGVLDEEAHFPGLSNSYDDKYNSDGLTNSYNDDDDPELIDVWEEKKATKEAIVAKLEDGRDNVGYESGEGAVNAEHEAKGGDEQYQDSDNANSLNDDSGEDDVEGDKKGKTTKTEKLPRYLGPCLDKCDLYVGMKFQDKK